MEHVTSKRTLVLVCMALLVFTFLTYAATFVNLGVWHTPVALGIAGAKALLIILFFMNARFSSGITRVVIGGGLLWLGLLIAGTMDDLITRGWLGVPGK
jgi:cytochrome c oxidase subunit IV